MPSPRAGQLSHTIAAGFVAVIGTTLAGFAMRLFFFEEMVTLAMWLHGGPTSGRWNSDPTFVLTITAIFGIPLYTLAIALFALVWKPILKAHDGETRCRCCNAVLRNLTTPACPICKEPI